MNPPVILNAPTMPGVSRHADHEPIPSTTYVEPTTEPQQQLPHSIGPSPWGPDGRLTREGAIRVIKNGGSTQMCGRSITRVEDIPTETEQAQYDLATAENNLAQVTELRSRGNATNAQVKRAQEAVDKKRAAIGKVGAQERKEIDAKIEVLKKQLAEVQANEAKPL